MKNAELWFGIKMTINGKSQMVGMYYRTERGAWDTINNSFGLHIAMKTTYPEATFDVVKIK